MSSTTPFRLDLTFIVWFWFHEEPFAPGASSINVPVPLAASFSRRWPGSSRQAGLVIWNSDIWIVRKLDVLK